MYPEQMYGQVATKRPIKKIILLILAAAIFIAIIVVLLFNGLVDSSTIDKDSTITLHRVENGKITDEKELDHGYTRVGAGTYAVSIAKKDTNYHDNMMMQVDNFLRITKLTHTSVAQAGTKLGSIIAGTSFVGNDAAWSYRSGGSVLFHDEDPLAQPIDTCETECFTTMGYSETMLIGLIGNSNRTKQVGTLTPPATTPTPIGSGVYPAESELFVDKNGSAFAVFDGKQRVYYYKNSTTQPVTISLEKTPAKGEDGSLVAVANGKVAIAYGLDYSLPNSGDAGDSVDDSSGSYTLTVYDTNGKKINDTSLHDHAQIRAFDINDAGDHFALITQDTVEMGKLDTGAIGSVWQDDAYSVGWLNDSNFIYATNNALYQSNTEAKSWPILANKNMAISAVEYIKGRIFSSVLFAKDIDQLSYALLIDPSKQEVNNSLLSHTQLKSTELYSIGFDGQEFQLYIKTKDDGTKPSSSELAPAYEYMKQLAPEAKVVVYE